MKQILFFILFTGAVSVAQAGNTPKSPETREWINSDSVTVWFRGKVAKYMYESMPEDSKDPPEGVCGNNGIKGVVSKTKKGLFCMRDTRKSKPVYGCSMIVLPEEGMLDMQTVESFECGREFEEDKEEGDWEKWIGFRNK